MAERPTVASPDALVGVGRSGAGTGAAAGMLQLLGETVGSRRGHARRWRSHACSCPVGALRQRRAELRALLGADGVRDDHAERVIHAAGKGYPDLVRLRAGEPEEAPDAVSYPSRAEQLRARCSSCARERSIAVVPFGGGTSVVGGVAPLRGEHAAVVALDMRALAERDRARPRVADGHRPGRNARAGAGAAPGGERADARATSRSRSSTSRWGAARRPVGADRPPPATGASRRWCSACAFMRPRARLSCRRVPASAAGPELRGLLVGSEGTLGVIGELALRVRPAPRERVLRGRVLRDFAAGVEALRALAQEHAAPAWPGCPTRRRRACRSRSRAAAALKGRLGRAYLALRGYGEGCLAILGFEGDARRRSSAAARGRLSWCAATAACRWGARRGRRGCGSASRRRTCATSCSRRA